MVMALEVGGTGIGRIYNFWFSLVVQFGEETYFACH